MKSYMFAVALCLGTAAAAQSSGSGQAGSNGTTTSTAGQGSSQSGSNWGRAGASEAPGTPVGQTNANPMGTNGDTGATGTDANGMQTGTGTTGAGTMGTGNTGAYNGMGGPAMAGGDYPACSRSVRDYCRQTNERGMRRRPRR